MIRTDNDIKDDVYQVLLHSELANEVSGEVRKIKRSPSSIKEDVVISILANDSPRQVQESFVNVNVYVRDLKLNSNKEEYYVEDTKRTKKLARVVADMFDKAIIGEAYRLTLECQRVLEIETTHEHCINNRLLYQCVNEY